MRVKTFIISIILSYSFSLLAQVVSVQSELSRDTIALGEQLTYNFRLKTGTGATADFPVFYDTISSGIEILELISIDTSNVDEITIITGKYLITSFEEGINFVAPKPVPFSFGDIADTAFSLPIALTVLAPEIDTTLAIKPIKPPINTPVSFREILPWALIIYGILLVLTIIVLLIYFYARKKKNPELFQMKPQEPAHIIALRNLDKLKEEKLIEDSISKKYYSRLTEIIRKYISDQYGIQTMESTSGEILEEFRLHNRDDQKIYNMLEELLQLADLVKFAKEEPLRKEKEQDLSNAYNFVNETYNLLTKLAEEQNIKEEKEKGNWQQLKEEDNNI